VRSVPYLADVDHLLKTVSIHVYIGRWIELWLSIKKMD
jgi:hypothetical protein